MKCRPSYVRPVRPFPPVRIPAVKSSPCSKSVFPQYNVFYLQDNAEREFVKISIGLFEIKTLAPVQVLKERPNSNQWRRAGLVVSALDFQSGGWWIEPSLCRLVVSSDKKPYFTLSFFTQVYK